MRKKLILTSFLIFFIIISSNFTFAQQLNTYSLSSFSKKDIIWFEKNPDSLPIWLTQEELTRLNEIGKDFAGTSPPPEPVRMPAEFEPMQGVLIRYPFGISYQIIKEMAEDVIVVTIVANEGEKNTVISQYQNYGVNLDNCDFLIASSNSYWTRDYGPWYIFNGDDEQGIVDFIYNRPRPLDDQIPTKYGIWQDIPVYSMSLTTAGGNYMTDGQGIAISTDLVWSENSGYTHDQINQLMYDYCGIETYHVVPDVNGQYIKHIDCWGKYLAPDIIMIREVPPSHSQYNLIESAVNYFESQLSCYGTPYNVVRVYTPNNEPYTNSLILNNKVLVPITGSQWDDEAIESYQTALPGYEVLGFTGSWESTDALHCRAMGITDRYMLYIEHTPLYGTQSGHDDYVINAKIYPYSEENLVTDSTGVYWKVEDSSWNFVEMEPLGNDEYQALIPYQENGSVVYYYIHAEDESGRAEYHPYIGEPMAYSFNTYSENSPPEKPVINGPTIGTYGIKYEFSFYSIDPDGDLLSIFIKWGDEQEETTNYISSGQEVTINHTYQNSGNYFITARAIDEHNHQSEFSEPFEIIIIEDNPPEKPVINGPKMGKVGKEYTYCISPVVDPDGDNIYVFWDWGDGTNSGWQGPYSSEQEICESHSWNKDGIYVIMVKLKDEYNSETDWAELSVIIPKYKTINRNFNKIFEIFSIIYRFYNFIK